VRQGQEPTLYELLPPELQSLRPAGRLDRQSSGLVILSDDGAFIHELTHPSFNKTKLYELTLDHPLAEADRSRLETGVVLTDGLSRVGVVATKGRQITVSLTEGRNRQLRRTLGALGYTITRLYRTAIGPYAIGQLGSGQWQEFTP
jgi:pseudouridine synthase